MWVVILLVVIAVGYVAYHAAGGREVELQRAAADAEKKAANWEQKWSEKYDKWNEHDVRNQIKTLEEQLEKPILAYFGMVGSYSYETKIRLALEKEFLLRLIAKWSGPPVEQEKKPSTWSEMHTTESDYMADVQRQNLALMRVKERSASLVDTWDAYYAELPLPRVYLALVDLYGDLKVRLEGKCQARSQTEHEWVIEKFFECRYCLGWIKFREGRPAQEWMSRENDFSLLAADTVDNIEQVLREYRSRPPTDFWAANGEIATREASERRNKAFFDAHREEWNIHHPRHFSIVRNGELVTFIKEKEKAIAYAEEHLSDSVVLVAHV